ncbi:MAG: patatin-like phospholipase family protein, partial [Planctomycetota bacterium]
MRTTCSAQSAWATSRPAFWSHPTIFFVRGRSCSTPHNPEDQQREVRQVCRANVAAPTFFPPSRQRVAGVLAPLVDGGIAANNPALLALAAAVGKNGFRDEWDNRQVSDVLLASFGTGEVAYRLSYA